MVKNRFLGETHFPYFIIYKVDIISNSKERGKQSFNCTKMKFDNYSNVDTRISLKIGILFDEN